MSIETVEDVIDQSFGRDHFEFGERYRLLRRVPLKQHDSKQYKDVKRKKPQNINDPSGDLLRRDEVWQPIRPLRFFRLERSAPARLTTVYDLENRDDFIDWFLEKYSDLEDGVYTAMKAQGRGKGWKMFFLLRMKDGKIHSKDGWKCTSNGTPRHNHSSYYTFPKFFMLRKRFEV